MYIHLPCLGRLSKDVAGSVETARLAKKVL
jgi:hypothetical protein